jgi:hypothetical protein
MSKTCLAHNADESVWLARLKVAALAHRPQSTKSIRTTRRGLGWLTSVKPASAKTWRLPT